ncbi:MAG: hypothetical protein ACRD2D_06080, partial [Terriglobales bacterium]
MPYPVLLLTNDAALTERVRCALASSLPIELHLASQFPPVAAGAWLAILLDCAAVTADSAAALFLAAKPLPAAPPVLW